MTTVTATPKKTTPKHTPLFQEHQSLNARIVDFGGWALPVNYGSQVDEHNAVRNACGMFDVSHMTVSDLSGTNTEQFLGHLLANDIGKLNGHDGKALYSCMLNNEGGVIDDLIVYRIDQEHFRLVTNAGTRDKDLAWIQQQAKSFEVVVEEKPELALVAIQGPQALAACAQHLPNKLSEFIATLKRFHGGFVGDEFVGRTGYTGEDGVEFIVSANLAISIWQTMIKAGVQPCGLGARDTLRLEAGMSLYGNDLDEQHTPIESGVAWTVANKDERQFIGKAGLNSTKAWMHGLELLDKGVLRGHQTILLNDEEIGEVTSGTFSPSLEKSIALARLNQKLDIGDEVAVAVRKKTLRARIVQPPFYKSS